MEYIRNMIRLNLPLYEHRLGEAEGQVTIFDPVRRKWVFLQPEEWVRQNMICFLSQELGYPRSLFRIESGLHYDRRRKRSDIEILDRDGKLLMLVECKAPGITVGEAAFYQAAAYGKSLRPKLILISNGLEHYCCRVTEEGVKFLDEIPAYDAIPSL